VALKGFLREACDCSIAHDSHRWLRSLAIAAFACAAEDARELIALRRDTVEHPFGTIKQWLYGINVGGQDFFPFGIVETPAAMYCLKPTRAVSR
jgi:hypothetical protein